MNNYLRDCVAAVHAEVPGVSLEVGPMETAEYQPLVAAGSDGLVVYQETYDRAIYEDMHTAGPKRNFDWRLETPERAYAAGFRRLGIGALFGLADWRAEAISVAAHASHLLRHCWKAQVTVSLPRLRPCAGEVRHPLTHLGDRELVQLICAFRLFLPDVGLVLSTREPAKLRNGMDPLGHHTHGSPAATPNQAATPARAMTNCTSPNAAASSNWPPAPANGPAAAPPPGSSKSPTTAPRRKSLRSSPALATSRCGRIGMRRSSPPNHDE